MDRFEKQAARFGAEILPVHVTEVDLSSRPFLVKAGDQDGARPTVIIVDRRERALARACPARSSCEAAA